MLYTFIVARIPLFGKGAVLFFPHNLQFPDRRADFPQEHSGYIAGGGSQAGDGTQRIEIGNVLKVLKGQIFLGGISAAD